MESVRARAREREKERKRGREKGGESGWQLLPRSKLGRILRDVLLPLSPGFSIHRKIQHRQRRIVSLSARGACPGCPSRSAVQIDRDASLSESVAAVLSSARETEAKGETRHLPAAGQTKRRLGSLRSAPPPLGVHRSRGRCPHKQHEPAITMRVTVAGRLGFASRVFFVPRVLCAVRSSCLVPPPRALCGTQHRGKPAGARARCCACAWLAGAGPGPTLRDYFRPGTGRGGA